MKHILLKKSYLLIVLPLIFIVFFYFKDNAYENPSSMIVSTSLTRLRAPNNDPIKIKPNDVEDGDTLNSTSFNYFINFNWQQKGHNIKAGDSFSLGVSGGLYVPNTTTPYKLSVTDETDPTFQNTNIGDIKVVDNIIIVTFNDNVDLPQIKSLGNLSGTVYLQCAVDFNNPAFQYPSDYTGNFKPNLSPTITVLDDSTKTYSINVQHYDINPKISYLFRAAGSTDQFSSSLAGLLYPGESIEAKLTITPTNEHAYKVSKLKFLFNDYSIDYMYGSPTGSGSPTYQDPSYNGIPLDNTKYTFTRINTSFERSEEHKKSIYIDDRRNALGEWVLDFSNNLNLTNSESYFNHYLSMNGSWTDSDAFQNHKYTFMCAYELEFENNLTENISSHTKGLKDVQKCNVTVSYIYTDPITQNKTKVISDIQYKDVYLDNNQFDNYNPTLDEIQNLETAGYTVDFVPNITLEENKDIELLIPVKQLLTSVTLKFETKDDLGRVSYPLNDIVKDNIWIKDIFYLDYQLTQDEISLLADIGYDVENIVNPTMLNINPDDNIIVVHLSKTDPIPDTTSSNTTTDISTTDINTTATNTTDINTTTATNTTDINTTATNTTDINTTATNTTDINTTDINTTATNTTDINTTATNTTANNTTDINTTATNTTDINTTATNTTDINTTATNTTANNTTDINTTTNINTTENTTISNTTVNKTTSTKTTVNRTTSTKTTVSNTTWFNTTSSNTTYAPSTTYYSSRAYYSSGGGLRPTYIPRTQAPNTTPNTSYYDNRTSIGSTIYYSLNTLPGETENTLYAYNSPQIVYDVAPTTIEQKSKFVSNNVFESTEDEIIQQQNTQAGNINIQNTVSEDTYTNNVYTKNTYGENSNIQSTQFQTNTNLNTQTTDVMSNSFTQNRNKENPITSNTEKIIRIIFVLISGVTLFGFVKGFKTSKK